MHVLILSTYPAENAAHGGQHRLKNIIASMEAAGHTVQSCGVLGSTGYPAAKGFVPFPGHTPLARYIRNPMLMEDWAISQLFSDDAKYFAQLARMIDTKPDVIFCEQPWLFGFARKWIAQKGGKARIKLVYGSQNIEYRLKRDIVETYYGEDVAEECAKLVRAAEVEAAAAADLIVAVSQHDADWLAKEGFGKAIVAANGVVDRRARLDDVNASNALTGGAKFALYCASAHPPNMKGFFDIFGNGAGCFPPGTRLVVAGSAGHSIMQDEKFHRTAGLASVYIDAGIVSEEQLTGLLATAHTIILPITQGGGTNLKAAEAIWAGSHVVATAKAMRGFEPFMKARGITVADEPPAFLAAIRDAFAAQPVQLAPLDRKARSSVLWSASLKPLVDAINGLGQ